MSRAAVFNLIAHDAVLNGLGIDIPTVVAANSMDDPPARPFVVIRFEDKTALFATRGTQNMSIWVHDDRGDYGKIDQILDRIIAILVDAVQVDGADGKTLTAVRYFSCSDDLWDDGYRTIVRYATFSVVSRDS